MNLAVRKISARQNQMQPRRPSFHATSSGLYRSGCYANTVDLGSRAIFSHCIRLLQNKPLEITRLPDETVRIRVMGILDYFINKQKQQIFSRPVDKSIRWLYNPVRGAEPVTMALNYEAIDVLLPLGSAFWLQFLAFSEGGVCARAEISHLQQEQLWPEIPDAVFQLEEICTKTYARLCKEPEFRRLRTQLSYYLIHTIGSDAIDLALRTRKDPRLRGLDARNICRIWRFRGLFERMQRENPKLLPVFHAWLDVNPAPACDVTDVVPLIRNSVLASGLSPKTWRYLARHGVRRLRDCSDEPLRWRRLMGTLYQIERMGWPDPVPLGFLRLLGDTAGLPEDDPQDRIGVPWWFWEWACKEAVVCRHDPKAYMQLQGDVAQWAQLVRTLRPQPDSNQRKRGLQWLRNWAVQQRITNELSDEDTWSEWLRRVCWTKVPNLQVVPLLSPRSIMDEAVAMHNCADQYLDACERGASILLSLRDPQTNRRVALMGLVWEMGNPDRWELNELAGPCNREVSPSIRRIAERLVRLINRHLDKAEADFENLTKSLDQLSNFFKTQPKQLELWPSI